MADYRNIFVEADISLQQLVTVVETILKEGQASYMVFACRTQDKDHRR